MKIGFMVQAIYALTGPGNGVRMQALEQAKALRGLGHEVVLMDAWESYPLASFDVVQFFTGGYPFYGVERMAGVRNLVFAPIIDSNEPNWKYRLAARLGWVHPKVHTIAGEFRRQALGCRLVVCRSTHERERIEKGLGVTGGGGGGGSGPGVEIVLNGVDPPKGVEGAMARKALGLEGEFLLHVSAYTQARKNVARLIEAVGPTGLPLVIAGTAEAGPELKRLEGLAGKYPKVRLLGYQPREMLLSLYAACKVFCLPSVHEGTGLVALEAGAAGAGVVITEHGGPRDYFGEWGYYVDPGSVESIRRGVEQAWAEPRGEGLRKHICGGLTWEASARSLVGAYERHMR